MPRRPFRILRYIKRLEFERDTLLRWNDSLVSDLDKLCGALARNELSAKTEIENQKKAIDLLMSQKKVLEETIEELKKERKQVSGPPPCPHGEKSGGAQT